MRISDLHIQKSHLFLLASLFLQVTLRHCNCNIRYPQGSLYQNEREWNTPRMIQIVMHVLKQFQTPEVVSNHNSACGPLLQLSLSSAWPYSQYRLLLPCSSYCLVAEFFQLLSDHESI
jgi:hypothetical protein